MLYTIVQYMPFARDEEVVRPEVGVKRLLARDGAAASPKCNSIYIILKMCIYRYIERERENR